LYLILIYFQIILQLQNEAVFLSFTKQLQIVFNLKKKIFFEE